jgi:hypothetical protein
MKIRLKTILAGPDFNGQPGEELNIPEEDAKLMIKGGYAEAVEGKEEEEEEKKETEDAGQATQT